MRSSRSSLFARLKLVVLAAAVASALPAAPVLAAEGDDATEDVIHMLDGRELHGNILDETQDTIVFELVDRSLGLRTKVTLYRADITYVKRDVPIKTEADPAPARTSSSSSRYPSSSPARAADEETLRYGRSRTEDMGLEVPTLYVVPMKGQMGTDIHKSVYEEVVEDIREYDPDVIIFELDSSDYPDLMIPEVEDPRESRGLPMMDEYRELINMLKDELSDTRQVIWVKDSVGFSSMLALAFDELYMAPEARLWGLRSVIDATGAEKWSDSDVRAKMMAAWSAAIKAFLEYGGYSMELADAMMWPEKTLSASFKGREVVWAPNDLGEYVLDSDPDQTVSLRAKVAEDLLISDGTVETLDDLAFLLGFREYREIGQGGRDKVEDYVDKWRRTFEQTKTIWADYQQHLSWASGDEQVKWLGRARRDLEQIINAMERYEAVEVRWRTDMGGITKLALEIEVEKLREQIRALKNRRAGNYGGGGGGGFGGGPG